MKAIKCCWIYILCRWWRCKTKSL